ncbi:MAG: hypothetical protein F7C07_02495, partial [Desulfurococcales archaeon]|nr:hypothetical protein [Desulfurococcales archaeon]
MDKRKVASLFLVALMVLGVGLTYAPAAQIKLVDRTIEGVPIPGLFYVNPPTEDKWVNIADVAPDDRNLQFNPFGVREIRFLLNYLVDRQFIVQDIYEGSAEPMFLPILPASGAYPLVSDIVDIFNLAPTQQLGFFFQEYNRVLRELNETYKKFGYALVFRTDPSAPAGKWLYFRYPDGTEEKVVINGLIRQEDERLYIGQQVARWIEEYMYIDVNEIIRDRILIRIWYGSDLVNRIADIGDVPAHFYTEGWITTAEDPIYWERYTVAFFYGPLLGYNPNHRDRTTWYYFNETLYNLTQKLWFGSYFPGQEQELLDEMWLATYYGLAESIRVWLVSEKTFYPVYQPHVTFMIHGSITGMGTVWPFRTIKTVDGTIRYLQ